ncbi:unnamed protein product [Toxocara canis]|uniref:Peptidase_M13_N domain-containing protein n=1 Tax=Toxocara canis TaxID=6265 RepID=A0A183U0B2_TOXCA|nr:unnamed protein product [Toxocara canis]
MEAAGNSAAPIQPSAFFSSRGYVEGGANLAIGIDRSATHHNEVVCTSKECVLIAGFLAGNLNDKVDPCDDFYEFACGNYGLNRHLPASKPLRHTLSDMQSRLNKQVKKLLESPITEKDRKWDRLAKGYYQKCLQEGWWFIRLLRIA